MTAVILVDSKLIDDDAQILKLHGRSDHISGADTNFCSGGPVTDVVRVQSLPILRKDHFDVTAPFLVC